MSGALELAALFGAQAVALLAFFVFLARADFGFDRRRRTELARRERRLAELHERVRLVLDGLERDQAIIEVDPTGRIVDWGSGAARLTGRSCDQALGRPLAGLFARPAAAEPEVDRLIQIAACRGTSDAIAWWAAPAGRFLFVELRVRALEENARFLVLARDGAPRLEARRSRHELPGSWRRPEAN